MEDMKEWSTDEASKFEAMHNNDKKRHKAARIEGIKNCEKYGSDIITDIKNKK